MAILVGNPYGRLMGTLAETVGGAARGRRGKLNTIRTKVDPSNPNTPDQVIQRSKFRDCLDVARAVGPALYQADLNRAIGELPGFQSLMSVLLNNISDIYTFTEFPTLLLGDLHVPNEVTLGAGVTAGSFLLEWTTELGPNGTASDRLSCFIVEATAPAPGTDRHVYKLDAGEFRSDADITAGGFPGDTDMVVLGWFTGSGTAAGLISNTFSAEGTSGA